MRFSKQCSPSYKTEEEEDEDEGILRDVEAFSWKPGGLLNRRRLYRFSTDAKFSFPLGNATSPAAVPVRPLRPDTEISTSLMISRIMLAVVNDLLLGFSAVLGSSVDVDVDV